MHRNLPRLFVISSLCLLVGIGLFVSYFATQSFSSPAVHQPLLLAIRSKRSQATEVGLR